MLVVAADPIAVRTLKEQLAGGAECASSLQAFKETAFRYNGPRGNGTNSHYVESQRFLLNKE